MTATAGNAAIPSPSAGYPVLNKTYKLENSGGVVNWFDQESFKANFCSIKDPTTSLLDNPATHDRTVAFCEKMAPGFVYDKNAPSFRRAALGRDDPPEPGQPRTGGNQGVSGVPSTHPQSRQLSQSPPFGRKHRLERIKDK